MEKGLALFWRVSIFVQSVNTNPYTTYCFSPSFGTYNSGNDAERLLLSSFPSFYMLKAILLLFFLLLTKPLQAQQSTLPPLYLWQQWDSLTTAATLERDFAQHRLNGVYGVCYNAGFDLEKIRLAASIAQRQGLEYHAWTPIMIQKGCDSTWYTMNRWGESAYDKPAYVSYYTTLDPGRTEVVSWIKARCVEVAQIPGVDYVQLDYIRYADVVLARGLWEKYGLVMNGEYARADYCYCDSCVWCFKEQTGIDIRRYTDPSKVEEWAQFRCDQVTQCVNAIAAAVHAVGKRVSADVFPGPASHAIPMVRQEWHKWQCDLFFPMNYNDFYLQPPSWVGSMTAEAVAACQAGGHGSGKVVSGLFICRDWQHKAQLSDPEHWGLSPQELPLALAASLDAGASGICLFSATSLTPNHWKALHRYLDGRYGKWTATYCRRKSPRH